MKVGFKSKELLELFVTPLDGLKGKQRFSAEIIRQYQAKVKILIAVDSLKDLLQFRSLNFESLKGDRKGQFSIRINKQYRLIIVEVMDDLIEVEIQEISKHYE